MEKNQSTINNPESKMLNAIHGVVVDELRKKAKGEVDNMVKDYRLKLERVMNNELDSVALKLLKNYSVEMYRDNLTITIHKVK